MADRTLQGALWKIEKSMFGQKWAKKWVILSDTSFEYYATEKRPKGGERPRKQFLINDCRFTEMIMDDNNNLKKPWTFQLLRKSDGYQALFAASDSVDFEQWMDFVSEVKEETAKVDIDKVDDASSGWAINIEPIHQFFAAYGRHDDNNLVDATNLGNLLAFLGMKLSAETIQAILKTDLDPDGSGGIAKKVFIAWWMRFQKTNRGRGGTMGGPGSFPATNAGQSNQSAQLGKESFVTDRNSMVMGMLPSDWVQSTEVNTQSGVFDIQFDVKDFTVQDLMSLELPEITEVLQPPLMSVQEEEWNDIYQSIHSSTEDAMDDLLSKAMRSAAFTSCFLDVAMDGVFSILSQYGLQSKQKDAKQIRMTEVDDDDMNDMLEQEEEVYSYQGLIFRMAERGICEADLEPNEQQRRTTAVTDFLHHKIAGNEYRGLKWVSEAIGRIREEDAKDKQNDPYAYTSTPLMCLVDYRGFRFIVMACPPIDEDVTLIFGRPNPQAAFKTQAAGVRDFMKKLSGELNLRLHAAPTAFIDVERNKSNLTDTVISLDMQVHRCDNGKKVYMMNFSRVLPPDSPRPNTNELITNLFRPEFVEKYANNPLLADAFRVELDDSDIEQYEKDLISGTSYLYGEIIPNFARRLDSLEILPYDSFSLRRLMHDAAINMRYLGKIYNFCFLTHSKTILIADATARCCKQILNQLLRAVARRTRVHSVIAEIRRRSQPDHFKQHNEYLQTALDTVVMEFFNLVLGESAETDKFWIEVIIPLLLSRFNFEPRDLLNPAVNKKTLFHKPQLMDAMCNNLLVRLTDSCNYDFDCPTPFTIDDFIFEEPKPKFKPHGSLKAHLLAEKAEEFMCAGMHEKAYDLLLLRLSLYIAAYGKIGDQSERARIHYRMAECSYALRNYERANQNIFEALQVLPRFTPLTGRLFTLSMCADFKIGQKANAASKHDIALTIYHYCLGVHHPVIVNLHTNLADMYFSESLLDHSYIMLTLALEMSNKVVGSLHICNGLLNQKVAIVLFMRGEFLKSIQLLKRAIQIFELGIQGGMALELDIATCQFAIAEVLMEAGDFGQASEYAEKSYSTRNDKLPDTSPLVIVSHRQLAMIDERIDACEKAIPHCEAVLQIHKKMPNVASWALCRFYVRKILGLCMRQQALSMRTLLRHMSLEMLNAPNIDVMLEKMLPYVSRQLHDRGPQQLIKLLIRSSSEISNGALALLNVYGDQESKKDEDDDDDDDEEFGPDHFKYKIGSFAPPLPVQLAVIVKLALELEGEEQIIHDLE